jgi:hypothetical protein
MAQLGQAFDPAAVPPAESRGVFPAGSYTAQIVESAMKDTKNGAGQYLELNFAILDGPESGRHIWARLNIVNANAQAAEIAARELSAICHAVGQGTLMDSEQLHFKPLVIDVRLKPAGPARGGVMRDAQNEIRGYSAVNGGSPAHTGPRPRPRPADSVNTAPRVAPPPQAQAKPAANVPPWLRAPG